MEREKRAASLPLGAGDGYEDLTLHLPETHPVSWLWELHRAEHGAVAPCHISLDKGAEGVLAPGTETEELERLSRLLADAGRARMLRAMSPRGTLADLPAGLIFFLPRDGMSAWMLAFPPTGRGQELTASMLLRALAEEKIVFGLDRELLNRLLSRPDRYFHLWLIARGRPPAAGEDGWVEECFPREVPLDFPDGRGARVDYTALRRICPVKAGEVICRLIPPGTGTQGRTVRGEPLPSEPGKPAGLLKGRNTLLSEDGSRLIAAREGHVIFTGRFFEVRTTLEIDGDVGSATGNLNYLGDIHIRGDVRSGYTVRATGSVMVDGAIEGTSVEAGNDLMVGQGVQGNGKAEIRAHRHVYARYLENCTVYTGGDLYSDCVIGCELYCDGHIQVTTGRGAVIGGVLRAGRGMRAGSIGARNELRTEVELGGQPYEDWQRKQVLRELDEMERAEAEAARQPDSPQVQQQRADLRLRRAVSRMRLDRMDRRSAQDRPADKTSPVTLTAERLYPGTVLSIDGISRAVERTMDACRVTLEHGRVRFSKEEGGKDGVGANP